MGKPRCKFKIGDMVNMLEFTDCFNVFHPRIESLRVVDRRLIEPGEHGPQALAPYWRIKATVGENEHNWYEGAERHFRKATPHNAPEK